MTGFQSKKTLRHADDVTLNHLIDLRKLEAENERLRLALEDIADFDGGDVTKLWKEMREIARAALKEKE